MYHADAWLMVLGVLLSLALVGGLVWYVNSVIPKALDERQWLTRFVALVLTVFLGVFVADLIVRSALSTTSGPRAWTKIWLTKPVSFGWIPNGFGAVG